MISRDHGGTWQAAPVKLPGAIQSLATDPATGGLYINVLLPAQPTFTVIPIPNPVPRGNQILVSYDHGGYASRLGPPSLAAVTAMAVDPSGAVYITGTTESQDFPSLPVLSRRPASRSFPKSLPTVPSPGQPSSQTPSPAPATSRWTRAAKFSS